MKFKTHYLFIFISIFVLDQIVKKYVIENLSYSLNSGVTLGFLQGNELVPAALNLTLILLLVILIRSGSFARYNIILVSILAAGCSNFLDRIIYRGVVDYIQISVFPVFNFADIVITLGIIVIVFSYLINEYKEVSSRKRRPGKEDGSVSRDA